MTGANQLNAVRLALAQPQQSPETNAQDTHHTHRMSAKESADAVDFVPASA